MKQDSFNPWHYVALAGVFAVTLFFGGWAVGQKVVPPREVETMSWISLAPAHGKFEAVLFERSAPHRIWVSVSRLRCQIYTKVPRRVRYTPGPFDEWLAHPLPKYRMISGYLRHTGKVCAP